ncbi:MAG: hypothetical protein LBI68_03515 [Azoarcus sp.]|jgi:hypothetical protein|nr:hypothetical protein [Azoarcus sp.]
MKTPRLILAACLSLSACLMASRPMSSTPPPDVAKTGYGTFVGIGPQQEERLAEEAASQLERIYPSHQNLLLFQQRIRADDSFGQRLTSALQRDGHFIRAWYDAAMSPQCSETSSGGGESYRTVPVCYLVDSIEGGMLRLTLYTAGEVWSRFYSAEADALRPLGAWTHQKG